MRLCLLLVCLLICPVAFAGGLLDADSPALTGEDSLSLLLVSLDSLGNPTSAESLYIVITDPSGSISLTDSMSTADSRFSAITVSTSTLYRFADAITNLISSGSTGQYSVASLVTRSDGLSTAQTDWFQLVNRSISERLAAIPDSTDIARSVWNTPQTNHVEAGSFGSYLDANISGISSGSGAFTVGIVTFDGSSGAAVPYAGVAVRTLDQSTLLASATADANGEATVNLNNGNYTVTALAPGYIFDTPHTLSVFGAATDTLYAARFDPGAPATPNLCRVFGWVYGVDGLPDHDATVSLRLSGSDIRVGGVVVSPFAIETTTDSTGYFALDVYPTADLTPHDSRYDIAISRSEGGIVRRRIEVPSQSSWQLTW